ncbi:F0F1 ATP synthase assembly protein I [Endozoicomonas sp. OPT23]|uniref:ATP synthase subunit I n=1 Tax=Endozoicomonas sp. OPT23 TaxID=2072845 RepID=UPI00129AD989|nr:ATP synthase subunit I [Endozoicomonas sp. OPT23]MRI33411.1 F0F1 ATP synthase assembly protein I [Endozoicomonas sp. OPT23]
MFNSSSQAQYAHLQQPKMHRVVVAQLLATFCLALLVLPFGNIEAVSALAGGLACSIPNAYLVWQAFRYRGAGSAKKIVRSFYQGEAGKFMLTAAAFTLIFVLFPSVKPLPLFSAFVLIQAVSWFTPFIIRNR